MLRQTHGQRTFMSLGLSKSELSKVFKSGKRSKLKREIRNFLSVKIQVERSLQGCVITYSCCHGSHRKGKVGEQQWNAFVCVCWD